MSRSIRNDAPAKNYSCIRNDLDSISACFSHCIAGKVDSLKSASRCQTLPDKPHLICRLDSEILFASEEGETLPIGVLYSRFVNSHLLRSF